MYGKILTEREKLFFPYGESIKTVLLENIGEVYNRIIDDESRQIYDNRILYSMTNDFKFIRRLVEQTEVGKKLKAKIEIIKKKKFIFMEQV